MLGEAQVAAPLVCALEDALPIDELAIPQVPVVPMQDVE